ncbi:MAG: HAD hydrolase-like protein [Verrucomicrobiota bacterium]
MFRNLIFDWSGTLVDDLGPVIEATNVVLESHALPPLDRESFRRRFRLPYREFYAELLPHVPLDELEARFRTAFDAALTPVTVLPHAREKLAWCAARGIRAFVLTSMDSRTFERQLDGFGLRARFEATYSGVLDKRDLIHQILSTHGLDPAETAFVGDMTHDVETARFGGLTSIAVLTGYQHPEILAAVRPDLTVPDLAALRLLLERPRRDARSIAPVGAMPQPDTIEIRRLRVTTCIGVPDAERATAQILWLTVRMVPGQGFDGLADEIARTIDYHAVAVGLQALAAARPRRLIETLAVETADWLLANHPLHSVAVTLEKHILPDTECVAVHLTRSRA